LTVGEVTEDYIHMSVVISSSKLDVHCFGTENELLLTTSLRQERISK